MPHIFPKWTVRLALALMLAGACLGFGRHSAEAQTSVSCQGKAVTIVHVGFEATVSGTDADDVIYIEGGWNTVNAGEGDDVVCTVGHFNTLYGGFGDDELVGEGLYNVLYGEEGDDILLTDEETGTLSGGAGRNLCNDSGC